MVLPPYVYVGDWREMKAHVAAVLDATNLSCMLYNNPIAYTVDCVVEHVKELVEEHENLRAIKESSSDVRRVTAVRVLIGDRLDLLVGVDNAIVKALPWARWDGSQDLSIRYREAPLLCLPQADRRWTRAHLAEQCYGTVACSLSYTENVAVPVTLAVENNTAAGQIYDVCEEGRPTIADWIRNLRIVTNWSGRVLTTSMHCPPPDMSSQLKLAQNLDLDSTKIRAELGYREVIDRMEALTRTINWEREHPPPQIDPTQFDYEAEDELIATTHNR
jgi:hypothetical protein